MTRKIPSHERTYGQVRDMILFGRLAPGQAVTIQGLVAELGAGMTPVREAIRRLSAEGALTSRGNRRISVPCLSRAQLGELVFARLAVEERLAEMAAGRLARPAIDALAEIDASVDAAIAAGDVEGYLEANHRFHFAIYAAAEAEILPALAQGLWLRFGPSLRVVCETPGSAGLPDRHRDALAALRAGDSAALCAAIRADILQGAERVEAVLEDGGI